MSYDENSSWYARDKFLLALDDAVRPLSDPAEITATYARMLGEHLNVDRCAYARAEADGETYVVTGDYTAPGVPSIVGTYRASDFGEAFDRTMRSGQPYVIDDVDAAPLPDRGPYEAIGIRAVIAAPLHKAGRLVAGMAVHSRAPRQWGADEVHTVLRVAARCWESIERTRVERDLRHSEAQLRAVFEQSIAGIAQLYPDGRFMIANESFCRLLGRPWDELAGMTMQELTHPDDLDRNIDLLAGAIAEPGGGRYTIEKRYLRKDGSTIWASVATKVLADESGRPTAVLGIITDVTERKEAERERERLLARERAAREEAERQGRAKDEFLATLSHELRTPLNAILGWAQVLRTGGDPLAPDVSHAIEVIERNARAQTRIIEDLLEMSRIISGQVRLDVRRVELAPVIESAIETIRHAAEAKGVALAARFDPDTEPVSGDPGRLQQVFWNLLSNSVKHCGRGGQVRVELARDGGHLTVSVTDDGEGIDPLFLPHVFDRFRQADSSTTRRHGGLGVGLSIVKQLVELHGGTVRATSDGPGRGATFTVSLPVSSSTTVVSPVPQPVDGKPTPALRSPDVAGVAGVDFRISLDGVHVLVVDDEADARGLIERLLGRCDAQVTTASSAAEAIDRLRRHRPHVIISDIAMPGEDGYSLIAKVRAMAAAAGDARPVPAVALTAYARSEDRTRALLAGFQSHLAKPVEPVELVAVVASLVGRVCGVQ